MAAQKGKGSAGGGSGGSGGKVGGSGVDAGVTGGKGAPDDNHSDISDEESQHEEEEKAADISGTLEFNSQASNLSSNLSELHALWYTRFVGALRAPPRSLRLPRTRCILLL